MLRRSSPIPPTSAAPSASMTSRPATSNTPSERSPAKWRSRDCANGAAYKVAPEALWERGAEVIKIGVEPNGLNINFEVGSTAPEALARKVREMRAGVGIALDADPAPMLLLHSKGHPSAADQVVA